ncbi:glycosyltransferase family 4 protein [Oxynema aestuarii]|uniref:Glycosyltransferase n=1 Tax=Oxynema aestuarii AP17 TaxID=2064643 RepID=A0A6H1TZD1_9CYAN|nr:glycosyltransferase family 4 protein [Oxynema aestuarii]QIZ71962.1 glycosyltransferase [Oxynema aestuarii AP17]
MTRFAENSNDKNPAKMRILVEGWRFIPHSYAIINHFQLLQLRRRPEVELFHRDRPFVKGSDWKPASGLLDEAAEATIRAIAEPPPGWVPDATLRMYCPFDLTPAPSGRTLVFGCTEWGIVTRYILRAMGVDSFQKAHGDNDTVIVTSSRWSRDGFVRSGADRDRVKVVPLGVDPTIYQPVTPAKKREIRRKFGWEEDCFLFLNVGVMWNERQGIDMLLKAFAAICDRHPEARLVLKGRDAIFPSRDSIVRASRQVLSERELQKIAPRLIYIGESLSCAQMAQLYQAADAYVSPYLAEGFNLPVLEAIACGLPVICTDGGPTDDFIRDEFALRIASQLKNPWREKERVFVVMPQFDSLVAHMERAIADAALRARSHDFGPRWVRDRFTWKQTIDRLLPLFDPAMTLDPTTVPPEIAQSEIAQSEIAQSEITQSEITLSGITSVRPSQSIIVEGWRFLPHSYAIANHYHLLEMSDRPNLQVFHRDAPFPTRDARSIADMVDRATGDRLRAIPPPPPDLFADTTLRIFSPLNLREAPNSRKTCVFGTTEWGIVHPQLLLLHDRAPLSEILDRTNTLIITPSNWSREGFLRSGAPGDRVTVVPHGVDPNLYHPVSEDERESLRRQLGWDGQFIFLNIGAMTAEKGIAPLLFAFAQIAETHPQARLVLKGSDAIYSSDESIRRVCEKTLDRRQAEIVRDRLIYIGTTLSASAIVRLYRAADVYVAPYLAEGFNLTVLEAIACGLPVICTRGGPTDDFTRPEFTWYIESQLETITKFGDLRYARSPNWDSLIALMERAIASPEFRLQARSSGPAFVGDRFTWRRVVDRLLEVILPDRAGDYTDDTAKPSLRERPPAIGQYSQYTDPTPAPPPHPPASYGVPADLTGKRVLELGTTQGYWSFEALRRGAREAIAANLQIEGVTAPFDRQCFDNYRRIRAFDPSVCSYRDLSLDALDPNQLGYFDVIFLFGTCDRVRYPLLLCDRLATLCRGELYLEAAILDDYSRDRGGLGCGYPGSQMLLEFNPNSTTNNPSQPLWRPTLYALAQLVKSAGFTQVKAWKLTDSPQTEPQCRGFVVGSHLG